METTRRDTVQMKLRKPEEVIRSEVMMVMQSSILIATQSITSKCTIKSQAKFQNDKQRFKLTKQSESTVFNHDRDQTGVQRKRST